MALRLAAWGGLAAAEAGVLLAGVVGELGSGAPGVCGAVCPGGVPAVPVLGRGKALVPEAALPGGGAAV
ncbi:MAG: hypothetical protein RBR73_08045, partial [Halothiobacillaceae bacterium]|nr:hypothetical protein [Halothiobacillaceae bacterium]